MMTQILLIAGCFIFGILGALHFIYVFATNKFDAIDNELVKSMQQSSPVLTKQTSMWKAWIGFNYSHSLGILWVPFIYIPLTLDYLEVLQNSMWLTLLLPTIALSYAILAKKYWFSIPFIGSLLAFMCFSVAFYQMHLR